MVYLGLTTMSYPRHVGLACHIAKPKRLGSGVVTKLRRLILACQVARPRRLGLVCKSDPGYLSLASLGMTNMFDPRLLGFAKHVIPTLIR
jgi:hypothetical protein